MEASIGDTTTEERMAGLEGFLERYLGARCAEYGEGEEEIGLVEMPDPLARFFRFAGRWTSPWQRENPQPPYVNRFCAQDTLCLIRGDGAGRWVPTLRYMDDRLVFVWENQGVWIAATERAGVDPPVWVSEDCSHRGSIRLWRRLEEPLSHFLVSFVLQELMFGGRVLAAAPGARAKFEGAGMRVEPVWVRGEYTWGEVRPSYYLAGGRFLVRHAPEDSDGDEWYGCEEEAGEEVLRGVGLPTGIG